MTASFEWAGVASAVVSGLAPVLAALLPGWLERRRSRGRRQGTPPVAARRGAVRCTGARERFRGGR